MTDISQLLGETLDRHAETVVLPVVTKRMIKRIRMRRLLVATMSVATAVLIVLGGVGIASLGHDGRTITAPPTPSPSSDVSGLYPPTFEQASGWNTETTGVVQPYPASEDVPLTWAANVPFADAFTDGPPYRTLRQLSPDGVVIVAFQVGAEKYPNQPNDTFPARTLPLHIEDAEIGRHWSEGQPAANVPRYLLLATVQGYALSVYIFFGSQHPSAGTLSQAQQELNRLQLPARGYSAPHSASVIRPP
jgi:hypothetical protein